MSEPNLRSEVHELACEIYNEVDHGECFYDEEMLSEFLAKVERFKHACQQYYTQNKEEEDDD